MSNVTAHLDAHQSAHRVAGPIVAMAPAMLEKIAQIVLQIANVPLAKRVLAVYANNQEQDLGAHNVCLNADLAKIVDMNNVGQAAVNVPAVRTNFVMGIIV